jgi:Flp pilus assembly protein TadG
LLGERLRAGNARGAAIIELALSLPLVLLILTGLFSFGVALNNYLMLTDAASIGGRTIAVSRGETTDPCKTASTAILGVAPLLNSTKFKMTLVLNGSTVYSNGTLPASCSSSSTTTGAAGDLVQGGTAQVTITYPCQLEAFGVNYAPTCTLTSQTTEVVQ